MDGSVAGPSKPKRSKYSRTSPLTEPEFIKLLESDSLGSSDDDLDTNDDDSDCVGGSETNESEIDEETQQAVANLTQSVTNATTQPKTPVQKDGTSGEAAVDWQDDFVSMKTLSFTKREEMLIPVPSNQPIDYFRHLFTGTFIQSIVYEINEYAVKNFLDPKTKEKSRISDWKELTKDEFLIFIGLVLHMGTIRLNRVQDYWKQDDLFNLAAFSKNMSRNRFLLIQRCLHFARNPEEDEDKPADRLYKVRPLITFFNERMSEIYYPGRELSLDESMVLWRGRLVFRQCIKNKRHKYGIKLYMLTTPTGCNLRFLVYTGMMDETGGKGHADKVVMELLRGKLNVGHSIYMDNFYNSYGLSKKLLDNGTYCTGTLRMGRKNSPKEIQRCKLKVGDTIAKCANGIIIAKWKDKRDVCYISSEFENKMVEVTNRRGRSTLKPRPIVEYNHFMSRIDRQDQLLSYYPCERKTIRWPAKIFIHILQLMLINSHNLYCKYSGNRMSLYDFRISVIRKLLKEPPSHPSSNLFQRDGEHVLTLREIPECGKRIPRKQCTTCYERGRRKDTTYTCKKCPGDPGYCLDCAIITHN